MSSVLDLKYAFKRTKEVKDKVGEISSTIESLSSKINDKTSTFDKLTDRVTQLEDELKSVSGSSVKKEDFQNALNELVDNIQETLINQTPRQSTADISKKF